MEKLLWDEKFKIGVEAVDKAHAKLFRITGKLFDIAQDAGTSQSTYREGVKYLEAYSMTHFAEEEAYMRSIRYKDYAHHKRLHDNFREKTLPLLKREMETSNYSMAAVQRFVGVMSNWLREHIMREDQAIVGKAVPRRSMDLSTLIPIISRNVNRSVQEVLQTETKLVSQDYKGQNIGKAFYCRQYYDIDGGARVQILLGVEELLLLRGVNRIPGMQAVEGSELTDEIVLPVFAELFQNMKKMFRIENEYELGKDKLLTREGFRTEFMKEYSCRLLFRTKSGHLIFCYRSWRIKKQ